MASPTIASTGADGQNGVAGTTHTVNYPATVNANETLIAIISVDNVGASVSSNDGGFTEIFDVDEGNVTLAVLYKIAAGTEGGGTFTITTAGSDESCTKCWAISGASTSQAPEVSTGATGSTTTPDPDTVTPTGGSKDYLFLACFGSDQKETVSGFPGSYTSTGTFNAGGGATACTIGFGFLASTASSENPGTFTKSGTEQWVACTVAIHPSGGSVAPIIHHRRMLGMQ